MPVASRACRNRAANPVSGRRVLNVGELVGVPAGGNPHRWYAPADVRRVADELASAADLARTKDGAQPAVLVRGAARHVTRDDGPGALAMLRPRSEDLFR